MAINLIDSERLFSTTMIDDSHEPQTMSFFNKEFSLDGGGVKKKNSKCGPSIKSCPHCDAT